MKYETYISQLRAEGMVLLYDNYHDVCVKSTTANGITRVWLKWKATGEHEVTTSNETYNDAVRFGEPCTEDFYERFTPSGRQSKNKLTLEEFAHYISGEGDRFILNPYAGVAFRSSWNGKEWKVYRKLKNGKEMEMKKTPRMFYETWQYKTKMDREEYEKF